MPKRKYFSYHGKKLLRDSERHLMPTNDSQSEILIEQNETLETENQYFPEIGIEFNLEVKTEKHLPMEPILESVLPNGNRFLTHGQRQKFQTLHQNNTDIPLGNNMPSSFGINNQIESLTDTVANSPCTSSSSPSSTNEIMLMLREILHQYDTLNSTLTWQFTEMNRRFDHLEELIVARWGGATNLSCSSLKIDFKKCLTVQDYQNLERNITEINYRNQLISLLTSIGGSSIRDFVSRVMRFLFSSDLMCLYNRSGKKNKRQFSRDVEDLIFESTKISVNEDITRKEVEVEIIRILHHEGDFQNKRKKKIDKEIKRRLMSTSSPSLGKKL